MNNKGKRNRRAYKLIYNPAAGAKRLNSSINRLELIKQALDEQKIDYSLEITKDSGDAKDFARKAIKQGYKKIIVFGGDGTVGEVVNGVAGSKITLGILPGGTFMNIARMLAIPLEIDKAVETIKKGKIRKIDVGVMKYYEAADNHYFLESVGIGLEASFHEHFKELERGNLKAIVEIFRLIFHYHRFRASIKSDDKEIDIKTHLITVNNAPISGASLVTAPRAKLNDNLLTVNIYRMSKFRIFNYLVSAFYKKTIFHPQITTFKTKNVAINTAPSKRIHADGRFFVNSPMEFEILPKALNVITGPESKADIKAFKG